MLVSTSEICVRRDISRAMISGHVPAVTNTIEGMDHCGAYAAAVLAYADRPFVNPTQVQDRDKINLHMLRGRDEGSHRVPSFR